MNITQNEERQRLIEWGRKVRGAAEKRGDRDSVALIDREIEALQAGRFMLAVMGKVKRGKSTFCNAFLGRTDDVVAPIAKTPATSVISKFMHGETESVVVHFRDGRRERHTYRSIPDFVTEDGNPENEKDVHVVEVVGPFPGLEPDLVLVDTPGAGSIHRHHDVLLYGFIPQADAVVFLVTARMPLAEDELDLLKAVNEQGIRNVFFAINKCDATDEGDIAEAEQYNRSLLSSKCGMKVEKIYRISAKLAFEGRMAESGLPELCGDIASFVRENKIRVLHGRFVSVVASVAARLAAAVEMETQARTRNADELQQTLSVLESKQKEQSQHRKKALDRFRSGWGKALAQLEVDLQDAEQQALGKAHKRVEETSVFGVERLRKALPTVLNETLNEALRVPMTGFEDAARRCAEELRVSLPSLSRSEIAKPFIGAQDTLAAKAAVAGAGVALAGYGIASAAAAQAAAIAAANATAMSALTGLASTVGSGLSAAFGLPLTSIVTSASGLAAPLLTSTVPAWVAVLGPIGWAMAGVGTLAIPLAYRISRMKLKAKLAEAGDAHIRQVFGALRAERLPALRKMADDIAAEYEAECSSATALALGAVEKALTEKQTGQSQGPSLDMVAADLRTLIDQARDFSVVR